MLLDVLSVTIIKMTLINVTNVQMPLIILLNNQLEQDTVHAVPVTLLVELVLNSLKPLNVLLVKVALNG